MKIIFIKTISIILFASLLTSCSTPSVYYNFPGTYFVSPKYVPSSDEAVIKLLEEHKDKTLEELIELSHSLGRGGKYKESYNISKLVLQSNVQDTDIIADTYAFMGVIYRLIGGYEKSKYYSEKARALIEQCEYPSTVAAILFNAGAIYYELSLRDDWKYAQEGIEDLEEALSYYIQYSNTRMQARNTYSFLYAFYFGCPEFFNSEKAADYAYQQLAFGPTADINFDWDDTVNFIAMAYLAGGDWKSAEEFVEMYITRPPIREYYRNALHLFFQTVKGDMDMAKELADSMKRVEPFGSAPFSKTARLFGYPMLGYYSEAIDDTEAAKNYYYEYINSDEGLINANAKFFVDAEERLGMDFSEARTRLMQEIIDGRSISLELAGVEDEAAIALGFV